MKKHLTSIFVSVSLLILHFPGKALDYRGKALTEQPEQNHAGKTLRLLKAFYLLTAIPSAPTVSGPSTLCGTSSVTLTASGAAGATYNWYSAASGGNLLQSSTSTTFAPYVTTTTTYYVSATNSEGTSARTAFMVTVNPKVSSPFPNAYLSYSFSGNTKDVSGNQNDGNLQNSPTLTTDRFGATNAAYNFTGSSQYISSTKAITTPNTFTISAWFSTTATTGGRIVGFSSLQTGDGQYDRHVYMNNSGVLYFGTYSGGVKVINSPLAYNDGLWHHVVATFSNANGMKMYVDNSLVASNASNNAAENYASGYWTIGGTTLSGWTSAPTNAYFNGKIDDVAVYSTEFSATDVANSHDLNQIGLYTPVCQGASVTIYAPTITGATYSWTDPYGVTKSGTSNSVTFDNAIVSPYKLTVTGGPGACSSTATYTPPLYPVPNTSIDAPASTLLNTATTISVPAQSGITFAWTTNGGTPATPTGNSISVSWATAGLKTVTVTATNAGGCTYTSTAYVLVAPAASVSYGFQKTLTLKSSNAGITTNQTNFPALVYIQDDALIIKNKCNDQVVYPNGDYNGLAGTNYDFAFTNGSLPSASSPELAYQVEYYDQTAGILMAWVRIPTLTPADYTLNFYFGSLAPPHSSQFYSTTWASDYLGVYHFNDIPPATVLDATNYDVDGTPSNITTLQDQIRNRAGFTNTGGGYTFTKVAGNPAASSKIVASKNADISGAFTLSAWVNTSTPDGDNKIVSNEVNFGPGYKLAVKNNAVEVETRNTNNFGQVGNLGRGGTVTTGWHYVQGVFNGTTFQDYIDGAPVTTTTSMSSAANGTTLPQPGSVVTMGIDRRTGANNENFYNGSMDEVRISNVVKSDDWIKIEYYNQNNPKDFTVYSGGLTPYLTVARTIPGGLTYNYKGVTTTYTDAANWDITTTGTANTAPVFNGNETITVPTGKTLTLTSNAAIYGLNVTGSGIVNLGGNTLTVGCNIYNSNSTTGGIIYNNNQSSGITWNGKMATQYYIGVPSTVAAQTGNMTISNASTTGLVQMSGGPVSVYNTLQLTSGSLAMTDLASGAPLLTFKASPTAALTYGQIASIPNGATVKGRINYEVLFQGVRNYRSMAAPIYDNSATYVSTNGTFLLNGLKNTFIITGYNGTANGFDASSNNGATLRLYDSPTNRYNFVTTLATNTTIPSGSGFYMYYRGDRLNKPGTPNTADPFGSKTNKSLSSDGNYATPESLVMTYTGVPNQGSVTGVSSLPSLGTSATGLLYFVGNPYASTLDAKAIWTNSNYGGTNYYLKSTFWTWNPIKSAYAVYDASPSGVPVNDAKQYIVPGQAFFVQNTNKSGSGRALTFTESMKDASNSANAVRLLSNSAPQETQISYAITKLQLYKNNVVNDEIAVVLLPGSSDSSDVNDAAHMNGDFMNLTTITPDNQYLSIDKRPFTGAKKIIPLFLNVAVDTVYKFRNTLNTSAMSNYKVTLYDSLLNNYIDITKIDYAFNVSRGVPATYGGARFKLIIEAKAAQVTYFDFKGKLTTNKEGLLTWQTNIYREGVTYQLQRSQDNKTFVDIGTPRVGLETAPKTNFEYLDNTIQTGTNYYRLVQKDVFDNTSISNTVELAVNSATGPIDLKNGFKLYPNPVADHFSIISDKTYQDVTMRLYDASSNLKLTTTFGQLSSSSPIQRNVSNLRLGVYVVELRDKNNKVLTTLKFVKQ